MPRLFALLALLFVFSPFARAADGDVSWGPISKSMLSEVAKYKTIGDFNELFLPQIDNANLRMKYDGVLAPRYNQPFPKFEVFTDKRGFRLTVENVTAEFVLVSARDGKWLVNGIEWRTSKKIDDPAALAKLDRILYPKKSSAIELLIDEARAQDGEAYRSITRDLPYVGVPIAFMATMGEYFGECLQRVKMNTWTPWPFSVVEEVVADVVFCPALSLVWPLSRYIDRRTDELGLKNLPEKQTNAIPRITCPSPTNRELKVEFLATEDLNERTVFSTYRWRMPARPNRSGRPESLVFRNVSGQEATLQYSQVHGASDGVMRLSNGQTMRMRSGMSTATIVAYNRFQEVCNDPAKLRRYTALFNEQERSWRETGRAPTPGGRSGNR